jgi:hypothetical protein
MSGLSKSSGPTFGQTFTSEVKVELLLNWGKLKNDGNQAFPSDGL